MRKTILFFLALVLTNVVPDAAWAGGDRTVVRAFAAFRWAVLPNDANFPEGITANPYNGDIFVSTFEFDTTGTETNGIVRFNRHGGVDAVSNFSSNVPLLGLAFNKDDGNVYVASVGDFYFEAGTTFSRIQRIAADFTDGTSLDFVAEIPGIGPPPGVRTEVNPDTSVDTIQFGGFARVPNGLAIDDGRLFISDSFQGAIFRIDDVASCPACTVQLVKHHVLLATAGFPPFGANGLAIRDNTLFIANTGDDRVLTMPLNEDGTAAGDPTVFARSINGADGLAVDYRGQLWVVANQADQIVALNHQGRVIAELGEFHGIRHDGSVRGLLFPASIAIVGRKMFVTNLALPLLGSRGASPSEPEADVTRDTISMIIIPRL